MNFSPVRNHSSLVEAVCSRLAGEIRAEVSHGDGWLPPERLLAAKLGVSRPVIREATKRLEQQGMLEIQHGNGIKIVDRLHRPLCDSLSLIIPDVADRLGQLYETRLSIEPDVAAYAAERGTKAHLRELRRIHRDLETAPDNDAAIQCDLAFHHALADACGNRIYRLVLDSLAELGLASRLRTIGRIGKQTAINHHAAILTAIEERDARSARSAMRSHILAAGRDMDLPALKARRTK